MQEKLIKYARRAEPIIYKSRYLIIGGIILGIFAFAALKIDAQLQVQRNEDIFNEQRTVIESIKFDEQTAGLIRELNDSNAEINARLDQDRRNPFLN
jgi:hypothetical protein